MTTRELANLVFDGAELTIEQHATDHDLSVGFSQVDDRTMTVHFDDAVYRVTVAKVRRNQP